MNIREIVEKWAGQEGDILKVEDLVFELDRHNQAELDRVRKVAYLEGFLEMKKRALQHTHGWLLCYGDNVPEAEVYNIIDQIAQRIQEEGENPITSIF